MADLDSDSSGTGKCPACNSENVRLKNVGGLLICGKCASKRFSSKVRKSIEEASQRQEKIRQQEAWRRRMDTAKRGVRLNLEKKHAEALGCFLEYLAILESKFGVQAGGLHPGLFEKRKDKGEILLIAGVYWDMAKIYDRMKGQAPKVRLALNKFIEFSIDRPHVIMAAEMIRKYIASGEPVNVPDFKNSHLVLVQSLKRCFIASAVYGPTSAEVRVLQAFRDQILAQSQLGRRATRLYYRVSPPVARAMIQFPPLAAVARLGLSPLVSTLRKLYKRTEQP